MEFVGTAWRIDSNDIDAMMSIHISILHQQPIMRTTLTIDDDIAGQLRKAVANTGKSFKTIVNDALRTGLANDRIASAAKPYRLTPVSMGDVVGPYDLDKALQLADRLDDQELARKLELRK